MDRERDRDRRPGGERYAPGASTYRPGRSPPPRDSYRSTRSPPRRPPPADTYVPASSRMARPRSRSPAFRRRSRSPRGGYMRPESDTWRRPRSPPRREYSPRREFSPRPGRFDDRRDTRPRSPPREFISDRYDRRSPPRIRERSPPPLKRSRDVSPVGSRGRSPPPAKRERLASPPLRASRYEEPRPRAYSPPRRPFSPPRERNYRPRSRSPPPREDRVDLYGVDTWRRRSPSPPRFAALDAGVRSGRESVASSRRSSPPVHPSRLGLVADDRPPRPADFSPRPRSPYRPPRSPLERERSPPRREPMPTREPLPPREREYTNGNGAPPSGPRNGDFSRVPPTGPAGGRYGPAMSPPAGPSMSMSAHSRNTNPILSAPSRPRGGGRGSFGGRDYSPYEPAPMGPRRGSGPWAGRGGGPPYHSGPPTGPRGGHHGGQAPFRGSANSTSTTYPRTQRFNTTTQPPPSPAQNYLADLPPIVPGGQKQKDMVDSSRLSKLEDEAKKLRELIAEKEAVGRRGKLEWERMEREGETASLRADLADEHLRNLNGEPMSNAAF
ncbi:hypothetical protein IWZ03DRAFT_33114 [Phyllosticta citriasiana]|uniref:Serine/arginine repetitive matrix protein 1 n=1 Tax=Phyllosticta citriasiana TaxID=595635 RepID=A0ABR1L1A8_9PEZI